MSGGRDRGREIAAGERCATCSDEGVPMRVVDPVQAENLATCSDPDGRSWEVQTDLVGPVSVGETLLVHAGVALARLSAVDPRAAEAR